MNTSAIASLVITNVLLTSAPVLHQLVKAPPVIINETVSMKKGFYIWAGDTHALKHGDIVAMPMNQRTRDYLAAKLGYPTDTMLLKRVAALPGETVCRHGDAVTSPQRAVWAERKDSAGSFLPSWEGCHTLLPTEIFLLGDHPASFDSRYFGPVLMAEISGTYKEFRPW
jgi:type IV secretory pathway protease TraF